MSVPRLDERQEREFLGYFLHRFKVLVVDHDPEGRDLLCRAAESPFVRVEKAKSVSEAVETVSRARLRYQCLLVGLHLEGDREWHAFMPPNAPCPFVVFCVEPGQESQIFEATKLGASGAFGKNAESMRKVSAFLHRANALSFVLRSHKPFNEQAFTYLLHNTPMGVTEWGDGARVSRRNLHDVCRDWSCFSAGVTLRFAIGIAYGTGRTKEDELGGVRAVMHKVNRESVAFVRDCYAFTCRHIELLEHEQDVD